MKHVLAFLACTLTLSFADLTWPDGQALPWFPQPANQLDAVSVSVLSADERLTLVALQGLINRTQPRLILQDLHAEEGPDTWPTTLKLGPFNLATPDALVKKYASEVKGLVLYDPSRSSHYRNLAATAAALEDAIPVTRSLHEKFLKEGLNLKIIADLTPLTFTTALEIYRHLHQHYWPRCHKRLVFSMSPSGRRGHHHHIRDLAAATRSATIWLDCRRPAERKLMAEFLADLTPGKSVLLGWHPTERSGVTTASSFGISTIPSDFFQNSSVYSGGDHRVQVPKIPTRPSLENKAYITLFISDGDNIQYNQHAMRRVWDQQREHRGKIALNWTISPSLVDIAPVILNYYYRTATPLDCFVSGPSGMGYLMPVNTLREPGAPLGPFLTDPARMTAFAKLTDTYLRRSGLRVLTIWDDASPMHRAAFEEHCPTLLGATVQNFKDDPSVGSSLENKRLPFEKLIIPYATTGEHLHRSLSAELRKKKPNAPLFLPYQINIWKELKPARLTQLAARLEKEHPGTIEFIRADHYFQLLAQSKGFAPKPK